jgi:hypothetical protein
LVYRLILAFISTVPMSVILGVFTRMPVAQALVLFLIALTFEGAAGLLVIRSNILDEDFDEFRVCLLPPQKKTIAPANSAATPATS